MNCNIKQSQTKAFLFTRNNLKSTVILNTFNNIRDFRIYAGVFAR